MEDLKKEIDKLLVHEGNKKVELMLSGQFAELCQCNGRIEAFTLVKNLLKYNYNIDKKILIL